MTKLTLAERRNGNGLFLKTPVAKPSSPSNPRHRRDAEQPLMNCSLV
jgi:hypothetical protein